MSKTVHRPNWAKAQVARYTLADFDLIRLRMWNATKRLYNGKIVPLGKAPASPRWSTMAVDSRKTRAICLAEGRNIGVRLRANQLVIDCDPRNGGKTSWGTLMYTYALNEDEWPRVITGSGGWHCYASLPDDVRVHENLEGFPGLEFKSIGRQVVAAGSRHPNGTYYKWDDTRPNIADGAPMIPRNLLKAIRQRDRSDYTGEGGECTVEQLAAMLARLDACEFRDELTWRNLMFACHHATDGEGEGVFVDWSASDPQFAGDSSIVIDRWQSCSAKDNAITYRSLIWTLREHGAADAIPARDVGDDFDDAEDVELEFSNVTDVRGVRS